MSHNHKRQTSIDMLPLSSIHSHESIDSNTEKNNPYLITVTKDEEHIDLQTDTPNNTPRDYEELDIDILNNKLNQLARITSVNSGSYFSDYRSLTPLSKNSSGNNLYNFNSGNSSENNSKQVSNVNLKKMMAMTAYNNVSNSNKYSLGNTNGKIQPGFAELMNMTSVSTSSLKDGIFAQAPISDKQQKKHKFNLHLVTSRDSEDFESDDEGNETKLSFPKSPSHFLNTENKSSNISQLSHDLKATVNQDTTHSDSDSNSNFSIVSSIEPKSPKSPLLPLHSAYQPSVATLLEQPSVSPTKHAEHIVPQKIKYLFILSGLPASGKSTLSKNMIQYMTTTYLSSNDHCFDLKKASERGMNSKSRRNSLFGANGDPKKFKIEIFNAGKIRRSDSYNRTKQLYLMANNSNEDLFSPKNKSKKDVFAKLTLDSLFKSLRKDGLDMAIFDATNSTRERRQFVVEEIAKQQREMTKTQQFNCENKVEMKIVPVFLQIMCTNKEFIKYNIYNKSFNDDYYDKPFDFAIQDFSKRVLYYSQQYCPITQEEIYELEILMRENGCNSNLYYINLENSSDSSYESNISEHDSKEDGILYGLLDFAKKYNSLSESIAYVHNVQRFLDSIDSWKLDVLESNLNDEYFDKLNRNLQRTCTKYGVKVPLIK